MSDKAHQILSLPMQTVIFFVTLLAVSAIPIPSLPYDRVPIHPLLGRSLSPIPESPNSKSPSLSRLNIDDDDDDVPMNYLRLRFIPSDESYSPIFTSPISTIEQQIGELEPSPRAISRKWSDSGFELLGEQFSLGQLLGEGQHGKVYFDAHSPDILIKVPFRGIDITPEVNALQAVGKFIGLHEENGYDAIVYKYTPGMTMKQLLASDSINGCFKNFTQFREEVFRAANDALQRLNDLNVEHLDAHFENILFTVNECQLSGEMIDFSSSRLLDPNDLEKKANALEDDTIYFKIKFSYMQPWIKEQFDEYQK